MRSSLTIVDSTVSGNSTAGSYARGGGIFGFDSVTLTNSTVSGNTAQFNAVGGGIAAYGTVTLTNSTVSGNSTAGFRSDGGGIFSFGKVALTNSIVLGNNSATDSDEVFSSSMTLNGGNIVGANVFSGGTDVGDTTAAAVFAAIDPLTGGGLLADNGGPLWTIALNTAIANPALDAASTAAPAADARGAARHDNPGVANANGGTGADLGAFEAAGPTLAADDAVTAQENAVLSGDVFAANPTTSDTGFGFSVTAVNGSAVNVGSQITLASGALLIVNGDGTFDYDPNGVFDNLPDFAASGASNTTVTDSFTYTITGGSSATATVTVRGVDSDDSVLGSAGADNLDGGAGNDTVDGGAGSDTMNGSEGSDSYAVNAKKDVVIEWAGGGADTVFSGASTFTLGANVEDLTLTNANNSEGIGNTLANRITGNTGNNSLQGLGGNDTLSGSDGHDDLRGGTGADRMNGGNGNDRFFVDEAGDQTIETNASLATGGIDTVFSTVTRTLGANLENLRLQGAADINGTGNELANKIFGTNGANLLQGLDGADQLTGKDGTDTLAGGDGNDTLSGGNHADIFRFTTSLAGTDTLTDFNKNNDRFDLGGGSFTALSTALNGDAVLVHTGGTIRIQNPQTLTLAQWNALVLPGGGAGGGPLPFDSFGGGPDWHDTLALTAQLQNEIVHLSHGDWVFA